MMRPSSAPGPTVPSGPGGHQQFLTERDLTPGRAPGDLRRLGQQKCCHPVAYRPDRGYAQDGVDLALSGTYALTLADGTTVPCRPVLALLKELAAQYAPERSEALTWVPAADVRRAVRMFATAQPSCYAMGWGSKNTPMPPRPAGRVALLCSHRPV